MTTDLFHHVHQGIRAALFDAIVAAARGDLDARRKVQDALFFTVHHGHNEDTLLVPLLHERLPHLAERLTRAHARIDVELHGLVADAPRVELKALSSRLAAFVGRYLEHLDEEETFLDPALRAAFSDDELAVFGRESVTRTPLDDARVMLRLMLPALPGNVVVGYLAKLPRSLADELRAHLGIAAL